MLNLFTPLRALRVKLGLLVLAGASVVHPAPARAQAVVPNGNGEETIYGNPDPTGADYFHDTSFGDFIVTTPGMAIGNGSVFGGGNRLSIFSSMASRLGNYVGSVYIYGLYAGKVVSINAPLYAPVFSREGGLSPSDGITSSCTAYNDITFGGVKSQIAYTWNQTLAGTAPNTIAWKIVAYATGDLPKVPTGAILSASGPIAFTGGQIVVTQPQP
jgi:hypothetical protein